MSFGKMDRIYTYVYQLYNVSGMTFDDKDMTTATDQDLTCLINELSQNTPVTWIDPDNNEISDSDTNNYVINQGTFVFGSKASTLTIKQAKLATLATGSVYKCTLKSSLYPTYSPDVVKESTLTFLGLSKSYLVKITNVVSSL